MGLSFAGIGLPLSTTAHQAYLEAIHPQLDFRDFSGWNFDSWGLEELPTPDLPVQPPPVCGVLSWPTGACRPAFFNCVVTTSKLAQIRAAVGDPMAAKSLVMSDGRTGKSITTDLYLLPPRPLNQLGHAASDAWLLSLTDARFFWPWRRGNISSAPASWASLVSTLAGFLGISITQDAVPSSYATPTAKWVGYLRNTPAVLDAALEQVGQRFIAHLDGTYRAVGWTTARGNSASYFNAAPTPLSGGRLAVADIARYVPSQVRVSVGRRSDPAVPYSVVVPLTGTVASGEYAPSTGFSGPVADFFGDLVYTGSNAAAAAALATQAASDWYGWRLSDADIVFPGVEPWVPTGWEDVAEWTYQERDGEDGPTPFASTLIRRPPFNDLVSGGFKGGLPSPPEPGATVVDCSWLGSLLPESCLTLTVPIAPTGNCACCIDDTQTFKLFPLGGGVWESVDEFVTCNGSGVARLDLSDPCCRPKLILVGVVPPVSVYAPATDYVMWQGGCGRDDDANSFAEFSGVGPDVCVTADLCDCDEYPTGTYETWAAYIDFDGITSDCQTYLAGNWTFTRGAAGTCVWQGTRDAGSSVTATLTVAGGIGTLEFSNGLTYLIDPWDCDDANEMTLDGLGDCSDAPATITVCPVPVTGCGDNRFRIRLTCSTCPEESSCCPDGAPEVIKVSLKFDDAFGAGPDANPNMDGLYELRYGAPSWGDGPCLFPPGDLFLPKCWYVDFVADFPYPECDSPYAPAGTKPYRCRLWLYCAGSGPGAWRLQSSYYNPATNRWYALTTSVGACSVDCETGILSDLGDDFYRVCSLLSTDCGCTSAPPSVPPGFNGYDNCAPPSFYSGWRFTAEDVKNCETPVAPNPDIPVASFNCVDGDCVDPLDGSGAYPTLAACQAACGAEAACCDLADGDPVYLVHGGVTYDSTWNLAGTNATFSVPSGGTTLILTVQCTDGTTWTITALASATSVDCGPPVSVVFSNGDVFHS